MEGLAVLATVIMLLQLVFSLYQVNYYNRFLKKLMHRYSNSSGYQLNTEIEKNIFSSVVVAMITNQENQIVEVYYYKGLTIFSKFKPLDTLKSKYISEELYQQIIGSKNDLINKALKKLLDKKIQTLST